MPATKQIDAMTAATALGGTEEIPAVQTAATVKITADQIKTFTSASPTLVTPVLGVATGTSLALGGNGALSAPVLSGTGTWITGGTSTTTKPYALIEPTGTTSTAWSTGGTGIGVNAASGFTGNLLDLQLNGAARLKVTSDGSLTSVGSLSIAGGGFIAFGGASTYLDVPSNGNLRVNNNSGANSFTVSAPVASASATFQHGALDAAAPVAQTIKFQDVVAGTSNTAGVNATIQAPAGTGTGNGGSLIFQVSAAGSSGSAKNAWATALTIDSGKSATFGGQIFAGGNVTVPAASSLLFGSNAALRGISTNVLRLNDVSAAGGAALEVREMTAPAAPATDSVRLYAEDNGSGKTRLMALFATGAAQQVAIEP